MADEVKPQEEVQTLRELTPAEARAKAIELNKASDEDPSLLDIGMTPEEKEEEGEANG
jgi:hypothetical protein